MSATPLPSPSEVKSSFALTKKAEVAVRTSRREIASIISGAEDGRKLVIAGPCSIHSYAESIEYAKQMVAWRASFGDKLVLVMRCYFEKPRTRFGWRGMVYDPLLDESHDCISGLNLARRLLVDITSMGVPIAQELLDPMTRSYFDDLVSWGAVGARTVESPVHRQMASSAPYAVGMKNGTSGDVGVAVDAILAASKPQCFFGLSERNEVSRVASSGNQLGHLVLRGGSEPNFSTQIVKRVCAILARESANPAVIIDCSHANSQKDYRKQESVIDYLVANKAFKISGLKGVMLESNLCKGSQPPGPLETLKYGVSVTDGCLDLKKSEELLKKIYSAI